MDKILGIIRHILTFLGGVLVTRGIVDPAVIPEITGALMTLIGFFWSLYEKSQRTGVGGG